ncbi:hypothetical protein C8R46DRAFT_476418 [Mycena filopes]|nr:hypothetical protein C8R46DRAFT_476418 [Mycena filopes]
MMAKPSSQPRRRHRRLRRPLTYLRQFLWRHRSRATEISRPTDSRKDGCQGFALIIPLLSPSVFTQLLLGPLIRSTVGTAAPQHPCGYGNDGRSTVLGHQLTHPSALTQTRNVAWIGCYLTEHERSISLSTPLLAGPGGGCRNGQWGAALALVASAPRVSLPRYVSACLPRWTDTYRKEESAGEREIASSRNWPWVLLQQ